MPVMDRSTVTLILPQAQGVASSRAQVAGMMVRRQRGDSVMWEPIDARLARAQVGALDVGAIRSIKVSR